MAKKRRIIIKCRIVYVNCWRPVSQYGGEEKYSLTAVISKDDEETVKELNDAIEQTRNESLDKWGGRVPNSLRYPIHDGDESGNAIYKNSWYVNMKSREKPQIVDRNVKTITDQTELYSGCYARVSCTVYAYSFGPAKGIGLWLGNIQKISDGPAVGGRVSAVDEFTPVPMDDFLQ